MLLLKAVLKVLSNLCRRVERPIGALMMIWYSRLFGECECIDPMFPLCRWNRCLARALVGMWTRVLFLSAGIMTLVLSVVREKWTGTL